MTARLLPWTGEGGKPCYLHSDGTGPLTRLADRIETIQLDMATDLLNHVTDLLADRTATPDQLRFAITRLAEALRDVHRIAHTHRPHNTPHHEPQDEDEDEDGHPPQPHT